VVAADYHACGMKMDSVPDACGDGRAWSMMPKSVKRFSGDIMFYLFDLEPDDSRSIRPGIIRL